MKILPVLLLLSLPMLAAHAAEGAGGPQSYRLVVDEYSFEVPYAMDAEVLAMAVDQELDSLLIGTDKARDSMAEIHLPYDLIHAKGGSFAVLVNGAETRYHAEAADGGVILRFFVPDFTEEIEIIGTHVIPEFPLGPAAVLAATVTTALVASRARLPTFRQ